MRASFGPALLLAGPAGASHQPDKVERGVVPVFFFPQFFFFFSSSFCSFIGWEFTKQRAKGKPAIQLWACRMLIHSAPVPVPRVVMGG